MCKQKCDIAVYKSTKNSVNRTIHKKNLLVWEMISQLLENMEFCLKRKNWKMKKFCIEETEKT